MNNGIKINKTIIIIYLCLALLPSMLRTQNLVVGYYADWLKSSLPASEIQFNNLTHVIHSFGWPTSDGGLEFYEGLVDANLNSKVHENNKKILIAFGGAGQSQGFGPMSTDSIARKNFIDNVYEFITNNNYDGIDIDWEFPENDNEKEGLTKLVKELRAKFDELNPSLLISMAVNSSDWGGQHFEYEKMSEYIDWFAMMGYDISGSWSSYTGYNAPLFMGQNDWSWNDGYNYLHSTRSIPNNKILLGMPFYGKQFEANGVYQGFSGEVVNLRYNEVMQEFNTGNWDYFWDEETKVPYLQNKDKTKFITYDDTNSVIEKVKYALEKEVAGVMIWAIGQDIIGNKQPLLEAIGNSLDRLTNTADSEHAFPKEFYLENNYPNPFNPSTNISFSIPEKGDVSLFIYDMLGKEVLTIIDNQQTAQGSYNVKINMDGFSSGMYFYKLSYNDRIETKKMIFLK